MRLIIQSNNTTKETLRQKQLAVSFIFVYFSTVHEAE